MLTSVIATGHICGHQDKVTVFNNDHQNEPRCWELRGDREQTFSLAMGANPGIPDFSMNAGLSARAGDEAKSWFSQCQSGEPSD